MVLATEHRDYFETLRTGSRMVSPAFVRFSARFSLIDFDGFLVSALRGDFDMLCRPSRECSAFPRFRGKYPYRFTIRAIPMRRARASGISSRLKAAARTGKKGP